MRGRRRCSERSYQTQGQRIKLMRYAVAVFATTRGGSLPLGKDAALLKKTQEETKGSGW
jgi:hypothetical protein